MYGALFDEIEVLTFDCYGTLIDWERGILAALRPVLETRGSHPADDELLAAFGRHESAWEAGAYLPYRAVLGRCLADICSEHGIYPTADEVSHFGASVAAWPVFDDSRPALERLATRYRLGVITNCDDELFEFSNRRLGSPFEWIVTAEQAGRYKPDLRPFEMALDRIGLPPERVLHVAQSLYHDHRPAHRLGLRAVWIDRRHGRAGGATPPAEAAPLLSVPDMASFADLALGGAEAYGPR